MKSMTYEEFLDLDPCWLDNEVWAARLAEIGARKARWTALDILKLDEVSAGDRLWAVLREDLIEAPILHEFACRCAERALAMVEHPDPRSVAAIQAKRDWVKGEISDDELGEAREAAGDAAWAAAQAAAWAAAGAAARNAAWAATQAARAAARAAAQAARDWQVAALIELLEGGTLDETCIA